MTRKQINKLLVPSIEEGCILSKGLELKSLQETGERGVVEVSPCASERGKVMAEVDLSEGSDTPFLDGKILCLLLESYENHFAEMRCSSRLGVGRLMWKAHRIYAYENGKFKVRFAHSREDAVRTLGSMGRLFLGSINCKKCGRPAIGCILGECEICATNGSPRVIPLESYFNGPLLVRGIESLKEAFGRAHKLKQNFPPKGGSWPSEIESGVERKLREAIEYAMNFSLETPNRKDSSIGVELIALARENFILLNQERSLVESISSGASEEVRNLVGDLNKVAWQINENLVKSLDKENRDKIEVIEKKVSGALRVLSKIRTIEDRGMNKDFEKVLGEFEKHIRTSRDFLEKIKM